MLAKQSAQLRPLLLEGLIIVMVCLGDYVVFYLLQSLLAGYWFVCSWFWKLFKFKLCSRCLYFLPSVFCVAVQSHSFSRKWLCWGFSSSGEKEEPSSGQVFTVSLGFWGVWEFLSGVWSRAILSKDLFPVLSAESPLGGFGCHMGKFEGLGGKFWWNNSEELFPLPSHVGLMLSPLPVL